MSQTTRTLLSLALGILAGAVLAWVDAPLAVTVADTVQPFGKLWLNALQMTVVPLVLALVVVGVNAARDAASSGRVARRAIVTFLVLLAFGATVAAVIAPPVLALLPHNPALAAALSATTDSVAHASAPGWADWFAGIVPSNAIAAAANNAMLPLVVFALFLGFALPQLEESRRALLLNFFQAISEAMIVIVRWVLVIAPLGVFALIFSVCARSGLAMLSALGAYIGLEIALYVLVGVLMIVAARLFGGEKFRHFAAAIAPAQAVGASTQSSLASLPAMLESATRLGYRKEIAGLVLPMAVTLFRITSPIQYVVSACFIAWAFGIDVSAAHLAAGVALAVVVSMGSVGLPGQVSFLATNLPVAQAMGLPIGPLGVMLAVDTLPDVVATAGNVTADMAATSIVARRSQRDVT
ncbi:MAG TPA: cation:dicarboxylase symporter family transporter [Rhodanobacteraceae bacterium]|nr:cation:dicarboxylase symporter family transporter [Rhodanobacteraceae bacterium]